MKIGITGHQEREGADWNWTRVNIGKALAAAEPPIEGWTSLAIGADQVFAREILKVHGQLVVVVPKLDYEAVFQTNKQLEAYRSLLGRSQRVIQLDRVDSQTAFFDASKMIVDETRELIAVWDELPSHGRGGTADVVEYARKEGKNVLILNPILRTVK